jgi:hypothetical protein
VDVEAVDGVVRLSVSDDGIGGADPARGSGLVGLRDRVEAVGGTLIVRSRSGGGTSLIAELPARSCPGAAETNPSRSAPLMWRLPPTPARAERVAGAGAERVGPCP